jgi:hypothetical protein
LIEGAITMPKSVKASKETCHELRAALNAANALRAIPSETVGFEGAQGSVLIPSSETTPEMPEGIEARIREIEQALREGGCDDE